jgi:hypothetical protein
MCLFVSFPSGIFSVSISSSSSVCSIILISNISHPSSIRPPHRSQSTTLAHRYELDEVLKARIELAGRGACKRPGLLQEVAVVVRAVVAFDGIKLAGLLLEPMPFAPFVAGLLSSTAERVAMIRPRGYRDEVTCREQLYFSQ